MESEKIKISDSIYIVGGGKWSLGLTHPLDCSIYIVDTGAGCIMIDSGCALETERIEAVMRSDGFSTEDVKILVLTHYHGDHACGAAWIHEKSGCEVFIAEAERECVAIGEDVASSLAPGRGKSYPSDFVYPACPSVQGLKDGDTVSLGMVKLEVNLVPGHSLCDLTLYGKIDGKNCLFTGDAIFAGGEILLQSLYDVSIFPYAEAVYKLSEKKIDALVPGHGQFVLSDGGWHVEKCADGFRSRLVPKQFHYFG